MRTKGITAEYRRSVCIHEAAHAFVYALGGTHVYSLQVAHVGATRWRAKTRHGESISGVWGLADVSNLNTALCCYWDNKTQSFVINKKDHDEHLAEIEPHRPGYTFNRHTSIRSAICAFLAGETAEQIAEGVRNSELVIEARCTNDDIATAEALTQLLPDREAELAGLLSAVETLLRKPAVWGQVERIADLLEAKGVLDEDALYDGQLLPQRDPAWPYTN